MGYLTKEGVYAPQDDQPEPVFCKHCGVELVYRRGRNSDKRVHPPKTFEACRQGRELPALLRPQAG